MSEATSLPDTGLRFFIDHGIIHDRETGKHVVTDGAPPFEDSIEQVCNLLNGMWHRTDRSSNYEDRHPTDEIVWSASDHKDLLEVVEVLGIQDSYQTPADAVRELHAEIERLRHGAAQCQGLATTLAAERQKKVEILNIDNLIDYLAGFDDATEAALAQSPRLTDGWVLVPRELTAENGAKVVLSGEFSETFDYCDEDGDECAAEIAISWSTIKAIHKAMVKHFAVPLPSAPGDSK